MDAVADHGDSLYVFSSCSIPGAEASEKLVSLQEFVLMAAETLDAPIIQSEAEMSAMRYAYKADGLRRLRKVRP